MPSTRFFSGKQVFIFCTHTLKPEIAQVLDDFSLSIPFFAQGIYLAVVLVPPEFGSTIAESCFLLGICKMHQHKTRKIGMGAMLSLFVCRLQKWLSTVHFTYL